jgi:signal transduction histidine kinase/ActR/RegA family two-component response regulator
MKEESISTAKLFELNCLVTAIAVAMRWAFHVLSGAGWKPIVADGLLAVILFLFYAVTYRAKFTLKHIIEWYLLAKQVAITAVWLLWGDWQSIWPPLFVLMILIYMVAISEKHYRRIALIQSSIILVLTFLLVLQENSFWFNSRQYWADYTHMTLYLSTVVTMVVGVVNNRVEDERQRAQRQAVILRRARKTAEQRRDLLMRLKDLQSDFFLEQDLQPSFNKLLQQLLEVTNSTYGFIGELNTEDAEQWAVKPHAYVSTPQFNQYSRVEQNKRLKNFFRSVYEGGAPVINNDITTTIAKQNQYGLYNYMSIPVTYNYKMVGAIVVANRPTGYHERIIEELSPFLSTYGSIIQNIRLKTAQKKYEDELRQAKELAEQSNRLKSQFLTNISHELRTPLSLILGPINLLQQIDYQQLGEQQWRQQLEMIEKNSKKMLSYIEDIVDLSKLNSESLAATPTVVHLKDFLTTLYQRVQKEYAHRALPFTLEYQLSEQIGVYIDADKLEKIIENFLSNAFKYTKDGAEEHVILHAELVDEELQIFCCDSGPGISQEHFERIFNRFYQVEQPNESIFAGTGVGLALCKELSELLNIQISVKSSVGEGSCFTIHIPTDRLRAIAPPTAPPTTPKETAAAPAAPVAAPPSDKINLLVVEDNRDMRTFLKQILQGQYAITTAKNGLQAWNILQEQPQQFELIITDLMMPEMDGYTLIQKMQNSLLVNHLPIVVLTAKAQFDERLRNLRIGVDDYLTKPFEVEELQVMVKHLLKAKATREQ